MGTKSGARSAGGRAAPEPPSLDLNPDRRNLRDPSQGGGTEGRQGGGAEGRLREGSGVAERSGGEVAGRRGGGAEERGDGRLAAGLGVRKVREIRLGKVGVRVYPLAGRAGFFRSDARDGFSGRDQPG